MSAAVYRHPENAGLTFDADARHLTCWNEGDTVTVPIGPLGLIEAGRALLALGEAGRCDEHRIDTGIPASTVPGNPGAAALTPDHLAEHAGAVIGHELLNSLLRAKDQAEAFRLIRDAVIDVNHPAAAGGFAVQVVDVMQRGLRDLPRFDEEDAA